MDDKITDVGISDKNLEEIFGANVNDTVDFDVPVS